MPPTVGQSIRAPQLAPNLGIDPRGDPGGNIQQAHPNTGIRSRRHKKEIQGKQNQFLDLSAQIPLVTRIPVDVYIYILVCIYIYIPGPAVGCALFRLIVFSV